MDFLSCGWAKRVDGTNFAFNFSGRADFATVLDHQVWKKCPVFARNNFGKIGFDLDGIGVFSEAESPGDSADVSIDYNSFVFAKSVTEHDVGSFAADPRDFDQLFHGIGDLASVVLHQGFSHADQGFSLVAEKTGRANNLREFVWIGVGKSPSTAIPLEKFTGDDINPYIRALGAENRGGQQLQRVFVVQRTLGVRILLPKADD